MAQGSILVVDDEPGLLDVLEWELTSLGYDVLAASSGTTAAEVLKTTEFDVVMSDVRMPGLSGIDVLRATKQLSPETEVIISTGYVEMETLVDCVRGGAFDFVQKPFNLPSLMATVERAIERKRMRASAQLFEASLAISANRDPQKLAELIAASAIKILGAEAVSLWLPTKDSVHLAYRKTLPGFEHRAPPVSADAVASVAALGRPKLLPVDAGGDTALQIPEGTGIVYPLKVGERLAGVLTFGRYSAGRPFRRADVERASMLASQVTLAIENARLTTQAMTNERLASIGQLAAGVAHEINNPVSYVMMSLETISELMPAVIAGTADAASLADVNVALVDAAEGAGRIRDIVGDLKNMARGDDASKRRVDMNEVVRAALRIAGAELRNKVKIERELGESVFVDGDAGRLSQVLVNLLVNAAQAAGPAGDGPLGTVRVRSWASDGKVRVSITDSGPGIPPEHQLRVFDPFFTTKPAGVGTGLGLPISRDIARAHGGDLELSAAEGAGACFTVTLPHAEPKR